jgi:predicted RNA methylase
MTPPALARALVRALQPSGTILEPCAGTGNFVKALRPYGQVHSCEIDRGEDFLAWTQRVDWIVTNPPWSQFRAFLAHSLQIADRVAFVSTLNHLWTTARRQLVKDAGFGIEKLVEFDAPSTWQATGFQLGLVLLTRGYRGACTVTPLPAVTLRDPMRMNGWKR